MSNATATVGALRTAVDGLSKVDESLYNASGTAVDALNAVGMTNTASAVGNVSRQSHQTFESVSTFAIIMGERYEAVAEAYKSLAASLEADLAPPLAEITGVVSLLNGRQEGKWKGAGATAYKEHTDLQASAATELSTRVLTVAKAITDSLASEDTMACSTTQAMATAVVAIVAALVPLLFPITTAAALAALVAAVAAFTAGAFAVRSAYTSYQHELESSLRDLRGTLSNGGSSLFVGGRWPSRGKLYSRESGC